jgi:hypothetical protein
MSIPEEVLCQQIGRLERELADCQRQLREHKAQSSIDLENKLRRWSEVSRCEGAYLAASFFDKAIEELQTERERIPNFISAPANKPSPL